MNVRISLAATLTLAALALQPAAAQGPLWPEAPVRVVVPFSAGGASDVLTRALAERLGARLGQNFVVENKTGAGGNIGMETVKSSPADGYTVASATIGTLSINQFLFAKMNYDPASDFSYVSKIWENCNVFVVAAKHPSHTVQEFLAWARKQPKGVTFGSAGVGTRRTWRASCFACAPASRRCTFPSAARRSPCPPWWLAKRISPSTTSPATPR